MQTKIVLFFTVLLMVAHGVNNEADDPQQATDPNATSSAIYLDAKNFVTSLFSLAMDIIIYVNSSYLLGCGVVGSLSAYWCGMRGAPDALNRGVGDVFALLGVPLNREEVTPALTLGQTLEQTLVVDTSLSYSKFTTMAKIPIGGTYTQLLKIKKGTSWILKMPLDTEGPEASFPVPRLSNFFMQTFRREDAAGNETVDT